MQYAKIGNALVRQSNKMVISECYVMDKGYNSEKNTYSN